MSGTSRRRRPRPGTRSPRLGLRSFTPLCSPNSDGSRRRIFLSRALGRLLVDRPCVDPPYLFTYLRTVRIYLPSR